MNEVVQAGPSIRSRRSQRNEDEEPVSLFLRKAYHVVCNCPPSLGKIHHWILNREVLSLSSELTLSPLCTPYDFFPGGWSAKGDTFIIKDAKKFSEKVIPTVYKHNNFSSFVRQLNFCKFRYSTLHACRSPLNWLRYVVSLLTSWISQQLLQMASERSNPICHRLRAHFGNFGIQNLCEECLNCSRRLRKPPQPVSIQYCPSMSVTSSFHLVAPRLIHEPKS